MGHFNSSNNSVPARLLVKAANSPAVSHIKGFLLNRPISKILIRGFIKRNNINMSEYEQTSYRSFNDFFCRKIRPELRPVDQIPAHLIAPCDGYLSIHPINKELIIPIKETQYTVSSLLHNRQLSKKYEGGLCLVFRLNNTNYHRYCYPDSGTTSSQVKINGNPNTNYSFNSDYEPVFSDNPREYCQFYSDNFGPMILMEVGTIPVENIHNHDNGLSVERGQEKGYFQYGGSTIIMLVRKNQLIIPKALEDNAEVAVYMGQMIARSKKESASRLRYAFSQGPAPCNN